MSVSQNTTSRDLEVCNREPIHTPGSIQPHGFLIGISEVTQRIQEVSDNVGFFLGKEPADLLGQGLAAILGRQWEEIFEAVLSTADVADRPLHYREWSLLGQGGILRQCDIIAHRHAGHVFIEGEWLRDSPAGKTPDLLSAVGVLVDRMGTAGAVADLFRVMVEEVHRVTGFDRVMLYGFDPDWNGTVLAESRNPVLPSYLDLRFPASDIPKQARELYRLNLLRLIPDCDYVPVPIRSQANGPAKLGLDLSFSVLRSVSPVHRAYMRNMGTRASMSVSILRGGNLWGLISCHSRDPRFVPFDVRRVCAMLAQVFALHLATREHTRIFEEQSEGRATVARLLAEMSKLPDYVDGLAGAGTELLDLTASQGAAILRDGRCVVVGVAPGGPAIHALADWLAETVTAPVTSIDNLSASYPRWKECGDCASGVLSVAISKATKSYILWFRPGVAQTVKWGGEPTKAAGSSTEQLSPRHSFALWQEVVRDRSLPWLSRHTEAAGELRTAIMEVALRHATKLEAVNSELRRVHDELESFSYSISHDLRGPLLRVKTFAALLRDDQPLPADTAGPGWIGKIIKHAEHATSLVDRLLAFTQLGRRPLRHQTVDVKALCEAVLADPIRDVEPAGLRPTMRQLPKVQADPYLLRIAFREVLGNALKFTRGQERREVEIGALENRDEHIIYVRDNGTGFDMKLAEQIFRVFERGNRGSTGAGAGVGLATARRVVTRHGGRIWAESTQGSGATFFIALPKVPTLSLTELVGKGSAASGA